MNTKMQEVESDIRAAVAAAQARGLVLTRGITNDGERCCLLGAFAEGPADTEDVLGPLVERWGLDETDLRDLMEGFDGLYMYATDWTLLGERLAHELGAAPEHRERTDAVGEPGATRYSPACNSPHSSRTIVECPVCHVLLGVAAGHGVHATCPGCLCVLATGHGGAGTETRVCEAMFSRKYGTERI